MIRKVNFDAFKRDSGWWKELSSDKLKMVLEDKLSIGRQLRNVQPLQWTPIFLLKRNVGLREGNFRIKVVTRMIRPFTSTLVKGLFLFSNFYKQGTMRG